MSGRGGGLSILFGAGLVLLFVGERAIGAGTSRAVVSGLGALAVVVALALRWLSAARSSDASGARHAERMIAGLYTLGAVALLLYFAQSDRMDAWFGVSPDRHAKLFGVLAALWPALLVSAVCPLLLVELAYASMARAPVLEVGRLRDALTSGLGLAFVLVFAFAAVYVFTERDAHWDLSYARTAKPGDSTRKIVRGLDQPVDVSLFFPPANDVHDQVMDYFTDLAKESPQLKVLSLDKDVDLAKAKELGVTGNGAVVLSRGGHKEQLVIGTTLEGARSELRNLDAQVQKRLLAVARGKRTIYLTRGHGERRDDSEGSEDQRPKLTVLKELLRGQNYETRNLSAAEGLAADVPHDAAAVLIIGPTEAFLPEELAALGRYVDGGGHLLVAIDPDSKTDLSALLGRFGVRYVAGTLCNDQLYIRRAHELSDRTSIATNSYSSHPSVTALSLSREPTIFLGAQAVELSPEKTAGVIPDFTVHALPSTWSDLEGNFEFNAPREQRRAYELVAAVSRRLPNAPKDAEPARAIVLGDSDALCDVALGARGNQFFAVDSIRWLMGDDSIAGAVNSEVDRPLEHTRKQDVVWFYSTVFAVPALVLAAGFLVTRKRKRAARGADAGSGKSAGGGSEVAA